MFHGPLAGCVSSVEKIALKRRSGTMCVFPQENESTVCILYRPGLVQYLLKTKHCHVSRTVQNANCLWFVFEVLQRCLLLLQFVHI